MGATKKISPRMTEHGLRMLGDNFKMLRGQWEQLLGELREDSELAGRIRDMLDREHRCEDCHGTGETHPHHRAYMNHEIHDCPMCGGSGVQSRC